MTQAGKYVLLDRAAIGGMAEIWRAKSFGIEGFEKIVALKRILPQLSEDEGFVSMFIEEAKIAGQLSHANIGSIYELGKTGDDHYIAMEYVWGKDLLQILGRLERMGRTMPPPMAAWIMSRVLEGLDYAHRKRDASGQPLGIIHRDVSLQNVLVSYDGLVKIIDFGIAKAASRSTATQAGVLKGKLGYMSPEQVRGMDIDHRSDLFAATTCLHEMLTGKRLFVGNSDIEVIDKVRRAAAAPPSELVEGIPPQLEAVVMRGLAREPQDRFQTAGEMQEALFPIIALSKPPFTTAQLRDWMRTAFAPELADEKAHLERLSEMARQGISPTGAGAVPPPPPPGAEGMQGEATVVTPSPFEAAEEEGYEELSQLVIIEGEASALFPENAIDRALEIAPPAEGGAEPGEAAAGGSASSPASSPGPSPPAAAEDGAGAEPSRSPGGRSRSELVPGETSAMRLAAVVVSDRPSDPAASDPAASAAQAAAAGAGASAEGPTHEPAANRGAATPASPTSPAAPASPASPASSASGGAGASVSAAAAEPSAAPSGSSAAESSQPRVAPTDVYRPASNRPPPMAAPKVAPKALATPPAAAQAGSTAEGRRGRRGRKGRPLLWVLAVLVLLFGLAVAAGAAWYLTGGELPIPGLERPTDGEGGPSRSHEHIEPMIGRLVESGCLVRGVPFTTRSSWTSNIGSCPYHQRPPSACSSPARASTTTALARGSG